MTHFTYLLSLYVSVYYDVNAHSQPVIHSKLYGITAILQQEWKKKVMITFILFLLFYMLINFPNHLIRLLSQIYKHLACISSLYIPPPSWLLLYLYTLGDKSLDIVQEIVQWHYLRRIGALCFTNVGWHSCCDLVVRQNWKLL